MDGTDYISGLPENVLVHIFEFVEDQDVLFTVCKSFYNAACIATEFNYKIKLCGNSQIRKYFNSIIGSKRIFDDFTISLLHTKLLSKNDIENLLVIFKKYGKCVNDMSITYAQITEKDICHILSFFPMIESLTITGDNSKTTSVPTDKFGKQNHSMVLPLLHSIRTDCRKLDFGKIFDNFQLTKKFETLDVTITDPTVCFKFLKNHSSITDLSITSTQSVASIPIDHLKLKSLTLDLPNSKQLLPLLDLQTELTNLDLNRDSVKPLLPKLNLQSEITQLRENLKEYTELYKDGNDDYDEYSSEGSDDEYTDSSSSDEDIYLLERAAKMNNLTKLNICINGIVDEDFGHFSKLSSLKQLSIASKKLDKITTFSSISMPNVTRLLLTFNKVRVPNSVFDRIANNFPNVNDLHYEGGYFCDAFMCFAGRMKLLEKLHIMRTVDFENDQEHFVPSSGTQTKANTSLKAVTLNFCSPNERNVHLFVIRLALIAPNIESLCIQTEAMRIVHNNIIYILRNFKNLKNIDLGYDLYPDDTAFVLKEDVEAYAKTHELKIIKSLKEYGAHLDYVEMCLSTPHDLQENIWRQAFEQQYPSIKIGDFTIIMKKLTSSDGWKLFA